MEKIESQTDFVLVGAGGHAQVVIDALLVAGKKVLGFFDPNGGDSLFGIPQLGSYDNLIFPDAFLIIAIGDNKVRKSLAENITHRPGIIIHPSADLSSHSQNGYGSMILNRVVVQTGTRIGRHVIINTSASVDHGCVIDDYVHIGPGSTLCGSVRVGEGAFIGAGSTVVPGVSVGRWSVVGAGAVVIKNVPEHSFVAGNPARVVRLLK